MRTHLCNCKRNSSDIPVYDNLSVTPKQMLEMSQEGTPISTQNIAVSYSEGFKELDFQPDLEHMRGVDISDMWQASKKFKKGVKVAKDAGKMVPVQE